MTSFQGPMNINMVHHPDNNSYLDRQSYFENSLNNDSNMDHSESFSKIRYKQMINHPIKGISSYNNNLSNVYGSGGGFVNIQQHGLKNYSVADNQNAYFTCQMDNNNIRNATSAGPNPAYLSNQMNQMNNTQMNNGQYHQESFGVYSRKCQSQNDGQLQFRNQIQISDANKVISPNLVKKTSIDDKSMSHIPSVNDRIASLCRNAKLESERLARSSLRYPRRAVTSLRYPSSNRINTEQNFNANNMMNNSQCQHYQGESFHCPNCLCFQENKYTRSRSSQRSETNTKNSSIMNNDQRSFNTKGMSQSISLNDINCTGIQAQLSIDDLKEDLPQGWLAKNQKYQQQKIIEDSGRNLKSENKESDRKNDLSHACDLAPGDFVNLIGVEENDSKDDGSVYLSRKDMEIVIKLAKKALIVGKQDTEVAASLKRGLDIHFGRAWHVVAGLGPYGSHVASVQGALAHFRLHGWAFLVWQTPDE